MPTYYRYAEDPTGANANNLVRNELHSLSSKKIRAAVPKYGPFFVNDAFAVYDNLTQRRLVNGIDYSVPVILREATLRYAQEVGDALLILNEDVSSQIILTYQAVGGLLQNNIDNIVAMYEAVAGDARGVDWVTGVLGKPSEYTPSTHAHYLSEVFGFEPLSFELERIAQAIMLGNSPAYDAILSQLKNKTVSEAEVDAGEPVDKYVTMERLIYALDKLNFNSMAMTPNQATLYNGKSLWFDMVATNVAEVISYYWTIEHGTTTDADFAASSGVLTLKRGKGSFMIQALRDSVHENDETFTIFIRRGSVTGTVIMKSYTMTLAKHNTYIEDGILEAIRIESLDSPRIRITAKTHAVHQGVWNGPFN